MKVLQSVLRNVKSGRRVFNVNVPKTRSWCVETPFAQSRLLSNRSVNGIDLPSGQLSESALSSQLSARGNVTSESLAGSDSLETLEVMDSRYKRHTAILKYLLITITLLPSSSDDVNRCQDGARVVKLRRKAGKIVQDCDVYIGRRITKGGWNLPQSKWHNPFVRANDSLPARLEAIAKYEAYLLASPGLLGALPELRGKVLGCWCKTDPSMPCHGDVLVRLLNAKP